MLTSLSVAQEQLRFCFLFSIFNYVRCAIVLYNVFLFLAEKGDVINEKPINATTFSSNIDDHIAKTGN